MWRLTTAILIGLLFIVPIVYVVMISLESPNQFLDHPLVPPVPPSVQNFSSAYQQGDLGPEVAKHHHLFGLGGGDLDGTEPADRLPDLS